ncbi:MAG: crotonase [Syntrophomonadaceae bacterium]|nr:crotonase [Syntrophomonadaceae bacterium]
MSYDDFKVLLFEKEDGIATVTINRPQVLNALNDQVFAELKRIFEMMEYDDEVRVAVITGAGDKAFVAGADISMMSTYTFLQARELTYQGFRAQQTIAHFPKPTIAAVNGFAFGGGCEIAMCCDIRIASERASFGQPEINLGIIPGGGGTQRLPRLVGMGIAKELVLTGQPIDAKRAYEIGLVNRVVPHEELMSEVKKMARVLMAKSSVTLSLAKTAMDLGIETDLEIGLQIERELFAECFATEDMKEGLTAFLEKRKPNFKGK